MLPVYYLGVFLCNVVGTYSNQRYARRSNGIEDILIYSLVTGLLAMAIFYVLSGFDLQFDRRTAVYAFLFSLLVFIGYFITMNVYRFMGVAESTFISAGLRLIATALVGVFLFGETFGTISFIQTALILLMLLALFLPQRKKQAQKKTITAIGTVLAIAAAIHGTLVHLLTNAFAEDTQVSDPQSFFFLTNVFTVLFTVVGLLMKTRFRCRRLLADFKSISPYDYGMIFAGVVTSNISSLLGVLILEMGSLVLYAPLTSALSLLAGEAVAVFFAKEKPRLLATVLALAAVFVVLLF